MSLIVFGLAFFLLRRVRGFLEGDILEADFTTAQAAAFAGFYLVCNLMITNLGPNPLAAQSSGWFYWSTYAAVWIAPALALWQGIRDRDRLLLDLGGISLLATILTNKSYLQWTRQTWDPILLGVFLMAAALMLRRWLARGPNGERYGFTPLRLLASENRALDAASALSLAFPHALTPGVPQPDTLKPGGGLSGGGGASGGF